MKNLFLSIISILLLNISCRSNNDEVVTPNKIIGKWSFVKTVIKSGKDPNKILNTDEYTDCHKKSALDFTADKFTEILYDLVSGNCKLTSNETWNYTIDSNNNLNFDGESSKIISLTSSELILQDDEGYDYDKDGIIDLFQGYLKR